MPTNQPSLSDAPHSSLLRRLGLARPPGAMLAPAGTARFGALAQAIRNPAAQPDAYTPPSAQDEVPTVRAAAAARHSFLEIPADCASQVQAGAVLLEGQVHLWAADAAAPDRSLVVSLMQDGVTVFTGRTVPGSVATIPTGRAWNDGCALALVCDGRAAETDGLSAPATLTAAHRAELRQFLAEQRTASGTRAIQRRLHTELANTLARLQRLDEPSDPVPAVIRHIARRAGSALTSTRLGLANWIIGELMEDAARRDAFCLDDRTAAALNEPAFNAEILRGDVTLALLCFWRRHYQSLDLFSDEGLRRLQNRFVTAPFMALHTNARLITPAIRARLTELVPDARAGALPWCWHWYLRFKDEGQAACLAEASFLAALSLREVVADALDPGRAAFTPPYWVSYWSGYSGGQPDEAGLTLSRFDLAMIGLLADRASPAEAVAEFGPAYWRDRLLEEIYRPMPGLARLSAACPRLPEPVAPEVPRCDVALIGHTNGTGLARNMDMFAKALAPLQPLIFDQRTGACVNPPPGMAPGLRPDEVRARLVVICANADQAPELIGRFAHLCEDAHVAGFFLWETDMPPPSHKLGAACVDEIWTPTSFVAEAYRRFTDVPVCVVGKGLYQPNPRRYAARAAQRRAASPAFTFLLVAEFASSIVRKNPLAGIQAFQAAFDKGNRGVRLLLKLRDIDPGHWSNIDGYWEEMERLIAADPRIDVVAGDLPEEDYWALVASADCLLSLHRGEGFAYFIGDGMLMGKPVVVSDYSGPQDFCTTETAFPVAVDVIAAPAAHLRTQGHIGHWAAPRIASAAAAMRMVVADRAEAARRAEAGRRKATEMFDPDAWGERLIARIAPLLPRLGGTAPAAMRQPKPATRSKTIEFPVHKMAHVKAEAFRGAVHQRSDD